ncbi:hypothetical protein HO133_006589 [Letharia lupina]|uniref:Uncharacterized protein n=1 Tax=Letharia lupina TaxID=560253 RepID=A0A8H6F6Y9_9LECA|nr:uncharacterized protein HO133_006589 [Letharia lupina]KAF6217762.1 hypothetical protein HO133_006589 [Letharia lupina]
MTLCATQNFSAPPYPYVNGTPPPIDLGHPSPREICDRIVEVHMAMASGAVGRFPVPSVKSKAGAAPKRMANDIAKEVAQKKTKEMKAEARKRKRGGRTTDGDKLKSTAGRLERKQFEDSIRQEVTEEIITRLEAGHEDRVAKGVKAKIDVSSSSI